MLVPEDEGSRLCQCHHQHDDQQQQQQQQLQEEEDISQDLVIAKYDIYSDHQMSYVKMTCLQTALWV